MFYNKIIGFFFAVLWCTGVYAFDYKIDRVEPAFWWSGMNHNQVELLVYGDKIADLTPQVNYPGVKLSKITRVDSKNYLFLELTLTSGVKPGKFSIDFASEKKTIIRYPYELLERKAESAARKGFSSKDTIYLITPDRFANGNIANDSVIGMLEQPDRSNPDGRHGGDIAGIAKHLDYIANMGFTQIWPTPLLENNQPKYSYHGYSITDFYKIDKRFGTNDDYRHLVSLAKSKNIGVIQDVVLNHMGSEHWWMKDLPSADWLNFAVTYVETNHVRTTIHDSYAAQADQRIFTDGWFVPTMPDLNQRNSQLANYLIQNTIWWIEYADLSGIRTDTYSYSDKSFLTEWSRRVMAEYPDINIVGEEMSMNPAVVSYWQRGKKNHDGYVSHTPSMMDFPLREALITGLSEGPSWQGGLYKSYEMLANDFLYSDPSNLVIFEGNHDTPRIFSMLNEDVDLYKLAMVYMATIRGIPQVFYGTEVLMTSPKVRDDGVVRSDFPGGWMGDKANAFTGSDLTSLQHSTQTWLKKLLNWRKHASAIHNGKLIHFAPVDGVYVYFRFDENQKIMVILNSNDKETILSMKRFDEVIAGASRAVNIMNDKTLNVTQSLQLLPKEALVLEFF